MSILTTGELAVGMFVTVHHNNPYKTEQFPDEISSLLSGETPISEVMVKQNEDRSGCGTTLQIKAIQLPYVVTIEPHDKFFTDHPITRDTRRTTFMELSPEFVEASKRK